MIKYRKIFSLNYSQLFTVIVSIGFFHPYFTLVNAQENQAPVTQESVEGQPPPPPTKLENEVAVFAGLDKITGRIIRFDVKIDETVQFGALQVTPKVCHTRPATETPQTTSFVKVDEVTLDRKVQPLFSGWMFAASPGLHAVEHAVYDVWLADCKSSEQFSEKPVTTSNDDLGGRGFGNDSVSEDAPPDSETDLLLPSPRINPSRI